MFPKRRIILNIVATYGRSLYVLVCGLFISRWVLAALGKTDFGLYGVVGGMMVIALLAFVMRFVRAELPRMYLHHGVRPHGSPNQAYTVKHIQKGLTLLTIF